MDAEREATEPCREPRLEVSPAEDRASYRSRAAEVRALPHLLCESGDQCGASGRLRIRIVRLRSTGGAMSGL